MKLDFLFFMNAVLLGVGLAMDAFAVSIANGLKYPGISAGKKYAIPLAFGIFQGLMPMAGWLVAHYTAETFVILNKIIPWVSFVILAAIGAKMIIEAVRNDGKENDEIKKLSIGLIIIQAVATSIDALSVGLTTYDYNVWEMLITAGIIAMLTFAICLVGITIGRKLPIKSVKVSGIIGGIILILVSIEILLTHLL